VSQSQEPGRGRSAPRPVRRNWRWFHEPGGRIIAREEMDALSEHGRAALLEAIKRFRMGDERPAEVKKLTGTDGLWEIRVEVGGIHFRAIFFYDSSVVCVCVTAVHKNQQKLPKTDRDRAIDRMKRWQEEGRRRAASVGPPRT
jgi:phage-related protein